MAVTKLAAMTSLRFVTILALVALVGCYKPTFADCTVRCDVSQGCPGGLACRGGYCSSSKVCTTSSSDGKSSDVGLVADAVHDSVVDTARDSVDDTGRDAARDSLLDSAQDHSDAARGADLSADRRADRGDVGETADSGQDSVTPPDARDAGDGAGPWSPGVLENLVLWLEADRGISTGSGDSIALWLDGSGQNNNAVEPDATAAPTLIGNAINGLPAVRFQVPSWMIIADTRSMRWGENDFVLLVVARSLPTCISCMYRQALFHKNDLLAPFVGPQLYLNSDGSLYGYLSNVQQVASYPSGYNDGTHLLGLRRTSTGVEIRADGASVGIQPAADVVNVDGLGQNAYIGAHGLGGSQFQFEGDIAAMLAVTGPLADSDLASLEDYLLTKYGIAPSGNPTHD